MNLAVRLRDRLRDRLSRPKLKPGMTIVEIVVVITIIAILAGIGIPATLGYLRRAKVTATSRTLENTKTAVQSYYGDTGDYPQSLEDLIEKPSNVTSLKWHGPYFEKGKVPKDGWNHELEYSVTKGAAHPFELFSWGPEGVDASEDNISVWDLD